MLYAEGEILTLEKAIQIAQSHEYSREQLKTMSGQEVHAVSHSHNQNTKKAGRSNPYQYDTKDAERRRPPQARTKHHQCKTCNRWVHSAKKCKTVVFQQSQTLPEQSDTEPESFKDITETNYNHDQVF